MGVADAAVSLKKYSQKTGLRPQKSLVSPRAVAVTSLLSLAVPGCYLAVWSARRINFSSLLKISLAALSST
jgi:hypothetical protein